MQRLSDLAEADATLVMVASDAIAKRFNPDWHVVGAAIRLRSGHIVTGVHLEANVGRIAVCAEAVALGRAATEHGETQVEVAVAVYHSQDGQIAVCAPCGMCRELISDYAPDAQVLVPDDAGSVVRRHILELLPAKYRRG